MTLLDAQLKELYVVSTITLDAQLERRLEALGLTAGTPVCILTRKRSGTAVMKVRGTRFAIGREIAQGISVTGGGANG